MLPRRHKLSRRVFPSQKEQSTTWRGDVLLIRYIRTKEDFLPRFAVVVSKKTFRRAVERNKARRIIYRGISMLLNGFLQYKGVKFIITVQKNSTILEQRDVVLSDLKRFLLQ